MVKEVGPGINDSRPKLLALLDDQHISLIVVEHQERLTRFGQSYLDTLFRAFGVTLTVLEPGGQKTPRPN